MTMRGRSAAIVAFAAAAGAAVAAADGIHGLPRTNPPNVVLTPFHAEELKHLHTELRTRGPDRRCLAWMFTSVDGRMLPAGVLDMGGHSIVKLNGKLYLGRGGGISEYSQRLSDTRRLEYELVISDFRVQSSLFPNDNRPADTPYFVIRSNNFGADARRVKCQVAKANCRRYSGLVRMWWRTPSNALYGDSSAMMARPDLADVPVVIEDMCPATSWGVLEPAWRKWRDIGREKADARSRIVKGIIGNSPLGEALK